MRGIWKVIKLPTFFTLRIPEGWALFSFWRSALHMLYIFLQCPIHYSDTCSRPFRDILHRIAVVACFTSVSVLNFWPHSSCLSIGNASKSHGVRSRLQGGCSACHQCLLAPPSSRAIHWHTWLVANSTIMMWWTLSNDTFNLLDNS
jgi:hypothetical protein